MTSCSSIMAAASRSACPRLCRDQAAAPDYRGLRASDQHDLVPRQLGSSCTSWGVRESPVRGSGVYLASDVRVGIRPSDRVAWRVPSSWDDFGSSSVAAGARGCSCRVGSECFTALFSTLWGGGSELCMRDAAWATGWTEWPETLAGQHEDKGLVDSHIFIGGLNLHLLLQYLNIRKQNTASKAARCAEPFRAVGQHPAR